MRFSDYVAIARAHWLGLASFVTVGILVAALAGLLATPTYTARAELVVVADTGSTNDLAQGSDYTQKQVRTYSELATRPIVVEPAIEQLGLDVTPGVVARQLSVTSLLGTNVISITATDPSPQGAANLANAIAKNLTAAVSGLVPEQENGEKTVRLESIRSAVPPAAPSSPNVPLWIILGAIGGLAAGACALALRETLDTKVRDAGSLERLTGAPLIGSISLDRRAGSPLLGPGTSATQRAEEYRQLRTNISFLAAGADRRLFVVTSSVPGEGKSTTAANLASTLAAAGHRVCLVEADLRRPTLGVMLGLEGAVGLSTVLIGRATIADIVQPYGPDGLDVVLAGRRPPNPSELLSSPRMAAVLDQLAQEYEFTILDCPPLLPVTDALLVAHTCGGAVLVTGMGIARRPDVARAVTALSAAHVPVIGAVANRVRGTSSSRYGYDHTIDPEPSPAEGGRHASGTDEAPPNRPGAADAPGWPGLLDPRATQPETLEPADAQHVPHGPAAAADQDPEQGDEQGRDPVTDRDRDQDRDQDQDHDQERDQGQDQGRHPGVAQPDALTTEAATETPVTGGDARPETVHHVPGDRDPGRPLEVVIPPARRPSPRDEGPHTDDSSQVVAPQYLAAGGKP